MSLSNPSAAYKLFNQSCYGLEGLAPSSVHALITDPPYGIGYQNHSWDNSLPDPSIWSDTIDVLKPGSFGAVFSSVRLMHRLMVQLEDAGFIIKDVLFWVYLNGMPKNRDVALDIDEALGVPSHVVGHYKYVQGYKKGGAPTYKTQQAKLKKEPASAEGQYYKGCGSNLKPAYEPIILVQKPLEAGLSLAQHLLKHGTGALNLEAARIPYEQGEVGVGHNPHSVGRVPSNLLRTDALNDGYDKFFAVPKVRQHAEAFNQHPTIKPVDLMSQLVHLLTWPDGTVLDPFMGSGSTGVACLEAQGGARPFVGYELNPQYMAMAQQRLQQASQSTVSAQLSLALAHR